jgi:nucleoside diphosphate kinase
MKEQLKQLQIPELSRENIAQIYAQGLLGSLKLPLINTVREILLSTQVREMVNQGKLTYAMIKPRLDEATQLSEEKAEHEIVLFLLKEIKPPLEIIFNASFVFDENMIKEFYGGIPKERQLKIPPIDPNRYKQQHATRWDEFKALMKQGPVTGLILYSEQVNAVLEWRNQMGSDWEIAKVKQNYPDSLRARYCITNHNNLLHGSDSSENAMHEIEFFARALDKFRNNS